MLRLRGRKLTGFRNVLILTAMLLCLAITSGCFTPNVSNQQVQRYEPNSEGISFVEGQSESVAGSEEEAPSSRPLRPGDPIVIHLRGIPKPELIEDMVDSRGRVNLPHIGSLRVEGKTTAESEALIERTYKEKDIFKRINVIIVAQQAEFFIQGEVKKVQGRFPLTADLTLLRAIATAGGTTPYAHPKNVTIIRGSEVLTFDRRRIREGRAIDPVIKPDDIIIVPKRKI